MTFFMKNILLEVKEAFAGVLPTLGLRPHLEIEGSELHLVFKGDNIRSPVRVAFEGPGEGRTEAVWQGARVEVDCFDLVEMGDTGWTKWNWEPTQEIELAGTKAEIVSHVRDVLERAAVVPAGADLPKIANSGHFAESYVPLRRFLRSFNAVAAIDVSRDFSGRELLSFVDHEGRRFELAFPPESGTAYLYVESEKIGEYPGHDFKSIKAGIAEHYQISDALRFKIQPR